MPLLSSATAAVPRSRASSLNLFYLSITELSMEKIMCLVGMVFAAFITAIRDSHGDPSSVCLLFFLLQMILCLLYLWIQRFERAVADKYDTQDGSLALSHALEPLCSYRVTGVIWGVAAVTSLVVYYLLIFLPQPSTANEESRRPLAPATDGFEG